MMFIKIMCKGLTLVKCLYLVLCINFVLLLSLSKLTKITFTDIIY